MTEATKIDSRRRQPLLAAEALTIAETDASQAYRDLSGYCIHVTLEEDGWHVDYELKDPKLKGGGPHYIIEPLSGAILSKRYEQ